MSANTNQHPFPRSADLWNEDLAPTEAATRTWDWKSYAALWVAMVVCVPTYMLAGGLVAEGLNWWQAVLIVFLGNLIVVVPMMLIGHAGAKHGLDTGENDSRGVASHLFERLSQLVEYFYVQSICFAVPHFKKGHLFQLVALNHHRLPFLWSR